MQATNEHRSPSSPSISSKHTERRKAEVASTSDEELLAVLRYAGFPPRVTLAPFDFDWQETVDRAQVERLHSLEFLARKEDVILFGPTGVGKTHLATSLAAAARREGVSVRYISAHTLAQDLLEAERRGTLDGVIGALRRVGLLVIDDIGLFDLPERGQELFLELVQLRHARRSTLLVSVVGHEDWSASMGPDISDALCRWTNSKHFHVVKMQGRSYRTRYLTDAERQMLGMLE